MRCHVSRLQRQPLLPFFSLPRQRSASAKAAEMVDQAEEDRAAAVAEVREAERALGVTAEARQLAPRRPASEMVPRPLAHRTARPTTKPAGIAPNPAVNLERRLPGKVIARSNSPDGATVTGYPCGPNIFAPHPRSNACAEGSSPTFRAPGFRNRLFLFGDHKLDPDLVPSSPCDPALPTRSAVLRNEKQKLAGQVFIAGSMTRAPLCDTSRRVQDTRVLSSPWAIQTP
jgi:hypothetical protein